MVITRINHYVPIWYQKRFLSSKQSSFYYLNLSPDEKELPDGRKVKMNDICWPFSPSKCFYQTDLYTTHYSGFLNDEIERYLFGKIDGTGSKAVEAMAVQEFNSLHTNFLRVNRDSDYLSANRKNRNMVTLCSWIYATTY
jgi:hypothetical protein